ncbi:MAG TPA: hypothetical protein VHC96_14700, partial [Puia sp.]|jgi:hypothetical protein|nr:hypothetical protein [Puia sp.]
MLVIICLYFFGCRKTTPEPPPPTDSVNLKSGLLLYLPFNGDFADSSGNNNPTVPHLPMMNMDMQTPPLATMVQEAD